MFIFFFKMKHATAKNVTVYMSPSAANSCVVDTTVKKARGISILWWTIVSVLELDHCN